MSGEQSPDRDHADDDDEDSEGDRRQPAPDGGTAPPGGAPTDPNVPKQSETERLGLTDFSKRNEELLKGAAIDA